MLIKAGMIHVLFVTIHAFLDGNGPAVRKALNHLLVLEIVQEVSGKKRDRVYVYREYLELIEKDARPL